jgi:hypothetical protein
MQEPVHIFKYAPEKFVTTVLISLFTLYCNNDTATLAVMYRNNVEFIPETNNCCVSNIKHSLMLICIFNIAFPGEALHVCIFHYVVSCNATAKDVQLLPHFFKKQ